MKPDSGRLPASPGERTVALLRGLIRNRCVNDGTTGCERPSALLLRDHFREYGLEPELLARESGRDNLVLRIPGTVPGAPSLAYMGHTDVVPAAPDEWRHPPFEAEIDAGEVWGRGAVDMLNIVAAQAVGIAEAWKANGPFPGDLLFIAPADEEASGAYGARWLTAEHAELVACDCMVTEIGGPFIEGRRGRFATIGVGEKGVAWLRFTVRGVPGHGSMPYRARSAADGLVRLGRFLNDFDFPVRLGPLYRGTAAATAGNLLEESLLSTPFLLRPGLAALARRNPGAAKSLHALSRTTASIGILKAGSKINMIPDEAILDLDVRLLPGDDLDSLLARLSPAVGRAVPGTTIEVLEYFPPTTSPAEGPLFESTALLLGEHCPGTRLLPTLIGGATDGRFWRRNGTAVYGFTLHGDEMSMDRFATLIHGRDERVSLQGIDRSRDYFTRLPGFYFRAGGYLPT